MEAKAERFIHLGQLGDYMKEGEQIKQSHIYHRYRQQCVDSQRERWRWAKESKMGIERDFAWVNKCRMQCIDVVLLNCTLETCMVLRTNVTLIN